MNTGIPLGKILALVSLLVVPVYAVEQTTRFVAQPESKVRIDGNSSMHDWSVEGRVINGFIEVGSDFPTELRWEVRPGKVEARVEASIPVASLKSVDLTGKPASNIMDKMMYQLLTERTAPNIDYHLIKLILKSSPKSKETGYEFDSQGALVVAGVTNQISMPIYVTLLGGTRLKIAGNIAVKMTDFSIQPPGLWSAPDSKNKVSQEIKLSYDKVKLSFEWFLEQEPVAAPKR